MDSAMSPVEFNDAEEDTTDEELAPRRGRRYKYNSANNQVFEMEVFHCSERNDHEESSAGSLQDVRLWEVKNVSEMIKASEALFNRLPDETFKASRNRAFFQFFEQYIGEENLYLEPVESWFFEQPWGKPIGSNLISGG